MLDWIRYVPFWLATMLDRATHLRDEDGATAVEYGVMVALIAAVIIVAVTALGDQVKGAFCTVVTSTSLSVRLTSSATLAELAITMAQCERLH